MPKASFPKVLAAYSLVRAAQKDILPEHSTPISSCAPAKRPKLSPLVSSLTWQNPIQEHENVNRSLLDTKPEYNHKKEEASAKSILRLLAKVEGLVVIKELES